MRPTMPIFPYRLYLFRSFCPWIPFTLATFMINLSSNNWTLNYVFPIPTRLGVLLLLRSFLSRKERKVRQHHWHRHTNVSIFCLYIHIAEANEMAKMARLGSPASTTCTNHRTDRMGAPVSVRSHSAASPTNLLES